MIWVVEISGTSDLAGCSNLGKIGAGDGAQTRDLRLGKATLYQLSYSRDRCSRKLIFLALPVNKKS